MVPWRGETYIFFLFGESRWKSWMPFKKNGIWIDIQKLLNLMPKRSILESKHNMWDRAIENRKSEPKSKPESNKVPRLLPIPKVLSYLMLYHHVHMREYIIFIKIKIDSLYRSCTYILQIEVVFYVTFLSHMYFLSKKRSLKCTTIWVVITHTNDIKYFLFLWITE